MPQNWVKAAITFCRRDFVELNIVAGFDDHGRRSSMAEDVGDLGDAFPAGGARGRHQPIVLLIGSGVEVETVKDHLSGPAVDDLRRHRAEHALAERGRTELSAAEDAAAAGVAAVGIAIARALTESVAARRGGEKRAGTRHSNRNRVGDRPWREKRGGDIFKAGRAFFGRKRKGGCLGDGFDNRRSEVETCL